MPRGARKRVIDLATPQEIVDRFPHFAAMFQIPDVANLILLSSQPGQRWSEAFFAEQLRATPWWKNTPEHARKWESTKLSDPALAGKLSRDAAANIIGVANSLGLHLSPAEVALYSEAANAQNWDDKALTRQLVDHTARDRYRAGTVRATQDGLRATASTYAVPLNDKVLFDWSKKIAEGSQTTQGFEDYARTRAKSAFPTLAKEIDAGFTVRQIADPYMQIASQTLGLNPETLNLSDPKWQRALQSRDAKGNIVGPMSTLDWQRTLMTDATYGYDRTEHAKAAALTLRDELGKTFGLTA